MKKASEAEKVLFDGLRRYPVIVNKSNKPPVSGGCRRIDSSDHIGEPTEMVQREDA
jgi:hypothetical protein